MSAPSQHRARHAAWHADPSVIKALLLLAVLAALAFGCSAQPDDGTRHLILISIDTLRLDRIGAYGHARARTSAIDSIASEGLRFEGALSHSSATLPSIASLLTGHFPVRLW